MGLKTLLARLVSVLRVNLKKAVVRGKIRFFNFWVLLLKMYIFEVVAIFLAYWLTNQVNFLVVVHIYKIRIFQETFSS